MSKTFQKREDITKSWKVDTWNASTLSMHHIYMFYTPKHGGRYITLYKQRGKNVSYVDVYKITNGKRRELVGKTFRTFVNAKRFVTQYMNKWS